MFKVTKAQIIMELEISIRECESLVELFDAENNISSYNYYGGRLGAFKRALEMIKKMGD